MINCNNCPECNSDKQEIKKYTFNPDYVLIECLNCGAKTIPYKNPLRALWDWNNRHLDKENV